MLSRRILGACVIVAVLFLWRHGHDRGDVAADRPAAPDSHITQVALSPSTVSSARPERPTRPARPARQAVPLEYRRDPLGFLSSAPVDSLQLLPGIGPVLAERLASARTGKRLFTRWDDVLAVKGIGPKKLQKLKELATE